MEVIHVTEPARRVVGMKYVGANANEEIGAMWHQFIPREREIQIEGRCFGVCRMPDGLPCGEFEYLACFESSGPAPEGMEVWDLPGGEYLQATCPSLGEIKSTIHWFYSEYLPGSEFESGASPMLEWYPDSFPQQPHIYLLFSVNPK